MQWWFHTITPSYLRTNLLAIIGVGKAYIGTFCETNARIFNDSEAMADHEPTRIVVTTLGQTFL